MRKKKIQRFEEMNRKEIESLDKERTMVIIPISPLEVHGPHLPVGTDILVTEELSKEVIKRLNRKRRKISVVLHPTLPIGYCGINRDLPGNISIDAKSFGRIIYDTLRSLSEHGFRYVLILTFHADPFYIKAIHKAIEKVKRKNPSINIAEPLSRIFYESKGMKIPHAGKEETSIMLYLYPYLVGEGYKRLKKVEVKQSIFNFRKTLKEMGIEEGYLGNPSEANIELGKKLFNHMVNICVDASIDLLESKYKYNLPKPLRYLPLFLQRR